MKFAHFDMETALYTDEDIALVQSGEKLQNIWDIWPFGISVAAIKLSDQEEPEVWYDTTGDGAAPYWASQYTRRFIFRLEDLDRQGYTITSWNGTGFDFQLLYRITQDPVVKAICWRHVDPCFQMLCMKGFPVGLEAAATVVGGKSKEENGISAPILWHDGDYDRVIRYVQGDVIRLETVIVNLCKEGGLRWRTKKGGLSYHPFGSLYTVRECIALPEPDTSWFTEDPERKPITRKSTMGWLEEE